MRSDRIVPRNYRIPHDAYESHDSQKPVINRKPSTRVPNVNRVTPNHRRIDRSQPIDPAAKKVNNRINTEKIEFLREFSSRYGYNGKIDSIRESEYPQLKGAVYLDHSGATTYAKSILTSFHTDLTRNLFGNPHSNNPSSSLTSHRVEQVRLRILQHFEASPDDYQVIFTQNATAAIKVAGEMFPWSEKTKFKYLRESHNSLLGLRRFAEEAGSMDISSVDENQMEELLRTRARELEGQDDEFPDEEDSEMTYNLLAYPAQCNFSGQRFPLSWTHQAKRKLNTRRSRYLVILDVAAYLTSSTLSLADKDKSPDFVAMSFYKVFGFPTGLGALLVKSELAPLLRKRYFGGGTIYAVAYDRQWQKFRSELSERFEDGTINFLDIISLQHAFNVTERIYTDFHLIKPHVTTLITYLERRMRAFRHWNGLPVVVVHSDHDYSDNVRQGPVFNFNVRKADGNWVEYGEVEKMASANGIHLRSGGLCNPGCIARWVDLSADEVIKNYKLGKVCGDDKYIFNNKITGAVRISLGSMTTIEDILAWLHFFENYYVESVVPESSLVEEVGQFYKQSTHNSSQNDLRTRKTGLRKKRTSISSPNLKLKLQADLMKAQSPYLSEKKPLTSELRPIRRRMPQDEMISV